MAVKLDRLPLNWQRQPELVRRYWDNSMKKIEQTLNAILDIPAIQEALEDLDTATQAAQDAADNANNAAANATAETSIVNSFPSNFTDPLLSADSSGNVTIANHNRTYGDSTSVAVTGNTVATSAAAASVVRIYYDDASRAGGAVTYAFTVDPTAPPVQGGNRHVVGAVTIPAAGTQSGNYVRPPGYVEP